MSNVLDPDDWLPPSPRAVNRRSTASSVYSSRIQAMRYFDRASIDLEVPEEDVSPDPSVGWGRFNMDNRKVSENFSLTPSPSQILESPKEKSSIPIKRESLRSSEIRVSLDVKKEQKRASLVEPLKEGGFWGWSTVAGAWMIQFCGFGYSNAFGVYQDFYTTSLLKGHSASQISWIGSTQVFFLMSIGVITGRLFDKGYFYHLLISGTILFSLSMFMLSLVKPEKFYQIFLSQGVAMGLGAGLTYIPAVAVVAQHFPSPHMRSLTMCIVASGSSVGGIVHPIMLNNLFKSSLGFANSVRASAGMVSGLQVLGALMMRAKYPKNLPSGGPQMIKMSTAVVKFSKDFEYMCTTLGMFLFQQGLFFPLFYIQVDAVSHNLNQTFSFYTLSILNAASLVGRVVPGFFARSFGVFNMLLVTAIACNALLFSMFGVTNTVAFAIFSPLFGFFSGAYVSLLAPAVSHMADHYTEIGARMGIAFAAAGLGALIGTPITGALLTDQFVWWKPIVFSGAICGAGLALLLIARVRLQAKHGGAWIF